MILCQHQKGGVAKQVPTYSWRNVMKKLTRSFAFNGFSVSLSWHHPRLLLLPFLFLRQGLRSFRQLQF